MSTFDVMMDIKYENASVDEGIVMCAHYLAMSQPEVKETEAFCALVELLRKRYPEHSYVLDICCSYVSYTGKFIRGEKDAD